MNKFSFIYLILVYLLFALFTSLSNIDLYYQIIGSLTLILLFGIPHGAIDNILLLSESNISRNTFYTSYIASIIIYIFLWMIAPLYSFIFFLIISAYHFGESQLNNYKLNTKTNKITYFIWGLFLISTLLFYNKIELINLFNQFQDTKSLSIIFENQSIKIIFIISNLGVLSLLIKNTFKKNISSDSLKKELFLILLIHISFFLFPAIICFTLYFVVLHSLKVLIEEFKYLKNKNKKFNLINFIITLSPYTFISILTIIAFLFMSKYGYLNISILLLSMISISVITLPHSVTMAKFYKKI